ncbi:hypothetical protein [Olleya sp. Bg11-27]|uniref:hypothetical protein n=1 Tax=Olleya sp. Bg11-27 TaxID=2058135 RepID=UPI0012FD65C9|nr:hypothetical protein [Olleya sp. Bg11-27]
MNQTRKALLLLIISFALFTGCTREHLPKENIESEIPLTISPTATSKKTALNPKSAINRNYIVDPRDHFFLIRYKPNMTVNERTIFRANLIATFTEIEFMTKKIDYDILRYQNTNLTTIINYINSSFPLIIESPDINEDYITVMRINYLVDKTEAQKSDIREDFNNDETKFLVEIKNFEYVGFITAPGTTPVVNNNELWFTRACCVANEIDDKIDQFYSSVLSHNTIQ